MHRHLVGFALSMLLLAGAGLFGQSPSAQAAAHNVSVADFSFIDAVSSGTTTTITVGDSVTWTWSGAAQHTVTSDPPGTDLVSGAPQVTGSYSHLFSTPRDVPLPL
jgi:plastocyanin